MMPYSMKFAKIPKIKIKFKKIKGTLRTASLDRKVTALHFEHWPFTLQLILDCSGVLESMYLL